MENLGDRAKNKFRESGTQYGLFTRGGATAAAHNTQLNLDRNPSHIAIKIDFKNAFNSIPRTHVLNELYARSEFAGLHQFAYWAYGQPSHLLVRSAQGAIAAVIQSAEGVRQGCALGSLAYGVATLTLLSKIKESFKDIEIAAYLDDVSISGSQKSALAAFEQLAKEASAIGLEIQREKCEVLIPKDGKVSEELQRVVAQHGFQMQRGALPLLGTAVGTDPKEIQRFVSEKLEKWKKVLEWLTREEIPTQLALREGGP